MISHFFYSFSLSVFICVHLWILFLSVCGLCAPGGLGAHNFAVGFRTAVAIELPRRAHLLDFIEIQVRDDEFVLIPAGLRDNLAARITEIAFAVELPDLPGFFRCHTIRCSDEIAV